MADEHIPAWKRLGLKVKKSQSDDPLSIPTHLEDASITKNQAKALKSQKRSREEANDKQNKPKKPPKRKKLPKSERPPPPEKDQLVYLRAFSTDKENWKFSKQKQNWLIKHVLTIPEEYDEYTLAYFKSIQGGSQIRVKRELKEVIDKWNEYANSVGNALLNSDGEKEKGEKEDEKVEDEKMKEKTEEKKIVISIEQAFKAQRVYEAVSGEKLSLATIDEDAEPEKEAKKNENEKESDETSEDEQKVLAENERKIMKNTKEKVEDKKEEVDNKEKTEKKDKKDKKDKKGKKDKKDKKGKKDKKDKIDKKEKEGNEESDNDARTPQPSNVTVNQEESSQAMSDQEISDEEDEGNYSNVWVEEVEVTDFV